VIKGDAVGAGGHAVKGTRSPPPPLVCSKWLLQGTEQGHHPKFFCTDDELPQEVRGSCAILVGMAAGALRLASARRTMISEFFERRGVRRCGV
jgi:hypothetical protein